jgi:hypothetical protein
VYPAGTLVRPPDDEPVGTARVPHQPPAQEAVFGEGRRLRPLDAQEARKLGAALDADRRPRHDVLGHADHLAVRAFVEGGPGAVQVELNDFARGRAGAAPGAAAGAYTHGFATAALRRLCLNRLLGGRNSGGDSGTDDGDGAVDGGVPVGVSL